MPKIRAIGRHHWNGEAFEVRYTRRTMMDLLGREAY